MEEEEGFLIKEEIVSHEDTDNYHLYGYNNTNVEVDNDDKQELLELLQKSTKFMFAHLQLINTWICTTFKTELIDTKSRAYKAWATEVGLGLNNSSISDDEISNLAKSIAASTTTKTRTTTNTDTKTHGSRRRHNVSSSNADKAVVNSKNLNLKQQPIVVLERLNRVIPVKQDEKKIIANLPCNDSDDDDDDDDDDHKNREENYPNFQDNSENLDVMSIEADDGDDQAEDVNEEHVVEIPLKGFPIRKTISTPPRHGQCPNRVGRTPSVIWNHFTRTKTNEGGGSGSTAAVCNFCSKNTGAKRYLLIRHMKNAHPLEWPSIANEMKNNDLQELNSSLTNTKVQNSLSTTTADETDEGQNNFVEEEVQKSHDNRRVVKVGRIPSVIWYHFTTKTNKSAGSSVSTSSAICNLCSASVFPRRYKLIRHMLSAHPKLWPPPPPLAEAEAESGSTAKAAQEVENYELRPKKKGRKPKYTQLDYWKYFSTTKESETGKIVSNRCLACGEHVSCRPERLVAHIQNCGRKSTPATPPPIRPPRAQHQQSQPPTNSEDATAAVQVINDDEEKAEMDEFLKLGAALLPPSPKEQEPLSFQGERFHRPGGRARTLYWKFFKISKEDCTSSSKTKITSCSCIHCGMQVYPRSNRLRAHLIKCLKPNPTYLRLNASHKYNNTRRRQQATKVADQIRQNPQVVEDEDRQGDLKNPNLKNSKLRPYWVHFETIKDPITRKIISNICKSCHSKISPRSYALKAHLKACIGLQVEDDVREVSYKLRRRETAMPAVSERSMKRAALKSHFELTLRNKDSAAAADQTKCRKCGACVSSKVQAMVRHLQSCDVGLWEEYKRLLHRRRKQTHSAQCEECGKVLGGNYLAQHMLIHKGVKPWICESCGKEFRAKCDLKCHVLRIHKGIRIPRRRKKQKPKALS